MTEREKAIQNAINGLNKMLKGSPKPNHKRNHEAVKEYHERMKARNADVEVARFNEEIDAGLANLRTRLNENYEKFLNGKSSSPIKEG